MEPLKEKDEEIIDEAVNDLNNFNFQGENEYQNDYLEDVDLNADNINEQEQIEDPNQIYPEQIQNNMNSQNFQFGVIFSQFS